MSKLPWLLILRHAALSVAAFGLGVLIRIPLQGVMGTKLIWLTFYPVVMLAALFGGVWSGLGTVAMSALFAVFAWRLLSPEPYVSVFADYLGGASFWLTA